MNTNVAMDGAPLGLHFGSRRVESFFFGQVLELSSLFGVKHMLEIKKTNLTLLAKYIATSPPLDLAFPFRHMVYASLSDSSRFFIYSFFRL